jgi:hypothetical protein
MPHAMINRQDALINRQDAKDLFCQFMQPESEFRVLRLLGAAKMGKSHLVTKVFPALARQTYPYQVPCAVLDLRNQTQTVPDILHAACSLLRDNAPFSAYHAAHQEWLNRPKVEVKGLQAILSSLTIRAEEEGAESRRWSRHLTTQFVTDLRDLAHRPVVLLFDAVEGANESTQDWLMDTLLVQLAPLSHLRVVVAGRSVPEVRGSYAALSRSFELLPVREEGEYIAYCRQLGAELAEQSIRDFALAVNYTPGLFADLVPNFMHQETARG